LDQHGLTVVGINETPKELEAEAFQDMGLPALYSSSNRTPNRKFELEDVLQMVIRQQQEQPITEIPEEESFAAEATTDIPAASKIVEKESEVACPTIEVLKGSTTENASKSTDVGMPQLPPMPPSATVYQGTVRSGQQVSSEKGCSLLILGSVSSGGEVLSDGDIMVLGKLRGRALAGLSAGSARIIATSMDPELISVGGVLSTGDRVNGIVAGAAAMVSLNDQKELVFQKISIT
jgi:septum site-determining protein MinC